MATLDREKARQVLIDSALGTDLGLVLDGLEECVEPDGDRWAEGFAKGYHAAAAIFHGPDPRLVTLTPEEAAGIVEPSDPDQRMTAYWYGFERTGFAVIDDVLSAVATAGKHYHGTDQWASPDSYNGEPTEEESIQAAANRAADRLRSLAARLEAAS